MNFVKKILSKKVNFLWFLAAIVFFIICVIELTLLIIAGAGFNSLTNFIKESQNNCAEYCESRGQSLFLHDVVTQACQCYNENEEPTDYKNLQTGVEFVHD